MGVPVPSLDFPLPQLQARSSRPRPAPEGRPRLYAVLQAPGHPAARAGRGGAGEGRKAGSGVGGAGAHAARCPARDLSLSAAAAAAAAGRRVEGGEKCWHPGREGGPPGCARRAGGVLGAAPPSFRERGCRLRNWRCWAEAEARELQRAAR